MRGRSKGGGGVGEEREERAGTADVEASVEKGSEVKTIGGKRRDWKRLQRRAEQREGKGVDDQARVEMEESKGDISEEG